MQAKESMNSLERASDDDQLNHCLKEGPVETGVVSGQILIKD